MVSKSPFCSMENSATGLPVSRMPSAIFLVQPGSMPITTTGGDVGVGAGADHGAEMQLEVLAELQAAIGMRDRQRALDVVGHRLAGGVGDVVHGQDEDVVAHADAAVLAPVALDGDVGVFRICHFFLMSSLLTSVSFCNCGCGHVRPWGCRR
jgi:hypothetical protein